MTRSAKFTLRIQFGLQQPADYITEQLTKLCENAPVDEIMFFYFAEDYNDGHESLDRIAQWIAHTRPARQMLKKRGVEVSLNPWHSLLHADRGRRLKPDQRWQTMVDPNGRTATAQVCPLDPAWRKYFAAQLSLYGPEKYRVVWIDDDIRFHNHAPLDWGGCFCPLHVAEFCRRAKVKATREQIVAACTASGKPHPWRKQWLDMWDDTQLALIASWRKLLAPFGTRLGLMSSTLEAHAAEGRRWDKWWQAFGGKLPPVHRPHFCSYGETLGRNLPTFIARLDHGIQSQPPGKNGRRRVESGPELDNGPYGPWNKPYSETAAQWALAQLSGADRLNISLFDFMGNDIQDEPERFAFLRAQRKAMDFLAQTIPAGSQPVGVGIPWSENAGRALQVPAPADGSTAIPRWQNLICPMHGPANWLGAAGVAFQMRPSDTANAIAGDVAWAFSDSELRQWLKSGLMLDGTAAAILAQRGFGRDIGLAKGAGRFLIQAHTPYSIERCTDGAFALRDGAMITINTTVPVLFQGELASGARVVSEVLNGRTEVVAHGQWVFENALGGRVAVTPIAWSPAPSLGAALAHEGSGVAVEMFTQRAAQIRKTMAWLAGVGPNTKTPGCPGSVTGAWLVPRFFRTGKRCRAVIWNAGADSAQAFTVTPPGGFKPFRQAHQIAANGSRQKAIIHRDGTIRLKTPLHTWEYVVLA